MILLDRRPGSATLGAYMEADTSAKVGFRPMHLTDPFGAAHLSGYGSGLGQGHNPFTPRAWELHAAPGLGDYFFNRPFDPWELSAPGLHGYQLGDASDDVIVQAADELKAAGHITTAEHDAILEGSMGFQDVLGYDPTDSSSWANLTSLFREVNQDLISLEQAYGAAGGVAQQGNAAFAQLGRDLIAKRQQYSGLATQFVRYYTLLLGTAPTGLSGMGDLGVAPLIWVAGAAAFIVGAFIALYAIRVWSKNVDLNAMIAQTSQGTQAALAAAMQKAQAAGDTVSATAYAKQLAAVGGAPASSMEAWLMTNAKWIGLGMGAIVILPGLLGGKRR